MEKQESLDPTANEADQVLRAPSQAAAWCSQHGMPPGDCFYKHHPEMEPVPMPPPISQFEYDFEMDIWTRRIIDE